MCKFVKGGKKEKEKISQELSDRETIYNDCTLLVQFNLFGFFIVAKFNFYLKLTFATIKV